MSVTPPQRRQPAYSYATYDAVTGRRLSEHIPLALGSYERALGGGGTVEGSLKIRDPRVRMRDVLGATTPRRAELWILRDGVPVWDGMIVTRRYAARSGVMRIQAADTVRWRLERLLLRPRGGPGSTRNLSFTQVDQFEIFRALLADAQSVAIDNIFPADLRVDADDTVMSGVLRDRHVSVDGETDSSYQGYEFNDYLKYLDDLADLVDGFEWRVDPYLTAAGEARRRLVLGYPTIGRLPGPDTHVLEYPGTITDYEWDEDASDTATYVASLGAGEESEMRWSEVIDRRALIDGNPLLEAAVSHKSTSQVDTLTAQAGAELARRRGPVEIPAVAVVGRPPVAEGDWVRLRISDPARWPDGPMERHVRVIGMRTTPAPTETTTLQLEEARGHAEPAA
ncbi:hypothetical protein FZ103_00320 [Streptomonospora sp. PA3]|uniref:hypothetical protein n=1 Tax=Streptomonospora sp. PA3 TaxID=2607326 RepID=UPI0012DED438|nr:hypothetical protein [Streptomonospora sp. PA3]MUL39638.1 hypothetical protein [Streptomonospora sp. PA3]